MLQEHSSKLFIGLFICPQVISLGSEEGPAGVTVALVQNEKPVKTTVTTSGGEYAFKPLPSGTFKVVSSHPSWKFLNDRASHKVQFNNHRISQKYYFFFNIQLLNLMHSNVCSDFYELPQ